MGNFKLIDLSEGNFIALADALRPENTIDGLANDDDPMPEENFLLNGSISDARESQIVAASADSGFQTQGTRVMAKTFMGPRIGPGNTVAKILHSSNEHMTLYVNDQRVIATGDLSPTAGQPQSRAVLR